MPGTIVPGISIADPLITRQVEACFSDPHCTCFGCLVLKWAKTVVTNFILVLKNPLPSSTLPLKIKMLQAQVTMMRQLDQS